MRPIEFVQRACTDERGRASILARQFLRDLYAFFDENRYVTAKIDHVDFRPYALSDEDFRGLNYLAVRQCRSDLIAQLFCRAR